MCSYCVSVTLNNFSYATIDSKSFKGISNELYCIVECKVQRP